MADKPSTFREFGILPDDLKPPVGTVRCSLSPGRATAQYVVTVVIVGLGILLIWFIQWMLPPPLSYVGCAAAALAIAAFVYLGVRRDYRWLELDGETIRARHLYTGRTIERSVKEIAHLFSIFTVGHHLETAVVNALLGKVKGMEIRFRDRRTPLRIMRVDPKMTNAEEFLQGVVYRMTQHGEIEPEIIDSEGAPLVRSIHWYGESPPPKENNVSTITLTVFLLAALMMGVILGGAGVQQQDIYQVISRPPQELTVAALIQNGPGNNRHVTITEFRPGEAYIYQSKNVNTAYVPLFPSQGPVNEIKVILSLDSIASEVMVRQVVQQKRITGVCSATESTSFGVTMGPELIKANQGLPLKSAWQFKEVRLPPTAEFVQGLFVGSYISFGLAVVLALMVFGMAVMASLAT